MRTSGRTNSFDGVAAAPRRPGKRIQTLSRRRQRVVAPLDKPMLPASCILGSPMNALVSFICPGLLIYWIGRTLLLLHATDDQIDEVLENDLWWVRRFLT